MQSDDPQKKRILDREVFRAVLDSMRSDGELQTYGDRSDYQRAPRLVLMRHNLTGEVAPDGITWVRGIALMAGCTVPRELEANLLRRVSDPLDMAEVGAKARVDVVRTAPKEFRYFEGIPLSKRKYDYLLYFSPPGYDKDQTHSIVFLFLADGGMHGGARGLYLLKRINQRWVVYWRTLGWLN